MILTQLGIFGRFKVTHVIVIDAHRERSNVTPSARGALKPLLLSLIYALALSFKRSIVVG